jgi:hypothetical protein
VAFSLAVSKAEGIFYRFIKMLGEYLLRRDSQALEDLVIMKRELSNIGEMYDSHRLFVIYNIVNIYYQCSVSEQREGLKSKEIEIERTLNEIGAIFEKYNQDTLYQNIGFITDFLNFEYYQKTGNQVRADFYYEKIKETLPGIVNKHFIHFFVIQFLNSKVDKFLNDRDAASLSELDEMLQGSMDIGIHETYHFISFRKFLAISKFCNQDYAGAARTVNELRNALSLKKYLYTDIECKLFQALQYCILGEDGLCQQIISSVKRQINGKEEYWEPVHMFIKILKTALKPTDLRKKIKRLNTLWEEFDARNGAGLQILRFVRLDDALIRRMANPIKE